MRFSQYYLPTLKEAPADAEVISHKLLTRAGMIRKLTSGIYSYLPFGLRAIYKSAQIVREEMNRAGAHELLMPAVQPADLWQESGRWDFYGKELLRIKDRHNRDYCVGPTHEEVITDLVRGEVRSYRQLPINLYQIQTKFRDEIRPRFGLMRGREFIMKDAYSFDRNNAGADKSYQTMFKAYENIFRRMGLRFRPVEADSGAIGGSFSHEFMVLADTGEDVIVACSGCSYAANTERAEIAFTGQPDSAEGPAILEEYTPDCRTIEDLAAFMKVPAASIIKTLLFSADGEPVVALVRGDRELNEIKLKNYLKVAELELAGPEQVEAWTGSPVGFAGPVGLKVKRIVADHELKAGGPWVVGANKADTHLRNVNLFRDVPGVHFLDLRVIAEGDRCSRCGGNIEFTRGIEVGHVFKLGVKYSEAMRAVYLDEHGKEQLMIMGCYGVGVSRVVAACVEQNHDEFGIKFPPPLAPFTVTVINLDVNSPEVTAVAEEIYKALENAGHEVLLDDRDERPGVKFKDADLIGIPMQLTIGGKGLGRGIIETKDRRVNAKGELAWSGDAAAFLPVFEAWRKEVYAGWGLAE